MSSVPMKKEQFQIVPQDIHEAMELARIIADSDLAPKDFKGKPGNVIVAMQMGAEVGLSPMQALQNVAVINGRPSLWGDALLAICQIHPDFEWIKEEFNDKGDAICRLKRKGYDEHVVTFTTQDMVKGGYANKQGPWQTAPQRMKQMRARGFALRDIFADALKGFSLAEEAIDMEPITVSAQVVDQPAKATTQGDRLTKQLGGPPAAEEKKPEEEAGTGKKGKKKKEEPPAPEPEPASEAGPEAETHQDDLSEGAKSFMEDDFGDAPLGPPEPEIKYITENQVKRIYGIIAQANLDKDNVKKLLHLTHFSKIPAAEYDEICAKIKQLGEELNPMKKGTETGDEEFNPEKDSAKKLWEIVVKRFQGDESLAGKMFQFYIPRLKTRKDILGLTVPEKELIWVETKKLPSPRG